MSQYRDSVIARLDGSGGPTAFLLQSWIVNVLLLALVVVLLIATLAFLT